MAVYTRERALRIISDLKRLYDKESKGYVTANQFLEYLSTHGYGACRQSVFNYTKFLEGLHLIKKDPYDAGLLYFVVPKIIEPDNQQGLGRFINADDPGSNEKTN